MIAKRPTMDDVARLAGVSKATVSAVLNGTGQVKQSTRDTVLAVIEQLNYRPAVQARPGVPQSTKSLGLLIRELDNPFFDEVIAGVHAFASQQGYTVLVASSEGDYETERQAIELLPEQGIGGAILYPVLNKETDLSHLFELKRRNFPFVLLEEIYGVQASLVDIDNVAASRKAVEYLISLGHTRIVHFSGPQYSMHSRERIEGMLRAFSGSRLVFTEDAIIPTGAHLEDGYRVGLEYFQGRAEEERPTAVTCYNDMVALGLCRALAELGLRVPEDISIVGYDNLKILDYLPIQLTTIHIPKYEIGEQAAKMLIRHIESREVLRPEIVQLEGDLVVRRSTGPAKEDLPPFGIKTESTEPDGRGRIRDER